MNNKLITPSDRELANSFYIDAIVNYINFIVLKEDKSTNVIFILLWILYCVHSHTTP